MKNTLFFKIRIMKSYAVKKQERKNLLYCFCIFQAGDNSHVLAVQLIAREHSVQKQIHLADASL